MRLPLFAAGLCCALLLPLAASAEMYAYRDANGVYHYTNAPGDARYKLTEKPATQKRQVNRVVLTQLQSKRLEASKLSRKFQRMSKEDRLLQVLENHNATVSLRPRQKAARQMYDRFFYDGGYSATVPTRVYRYNPGSGRSFNPASYAQPRRYTYPATPQDINQYILHAARTYQLDPNFIKAVIKTESNFNPYARSPKGAQGLMQLMPGTARDMNVQDAYDPRQNIMGGARYLRQMLNQFGGDMTLSLAAYNAGPNRVAPIWAVPNIPETRNYVARVMQHYHAYRGGAEGRDPAPSMRRFARTTPRPVTIGVSSQPVSSSIRVKRLVTVQ